MNCPFCGEEILPDEITLPMADVREAHVECMFRSLMGGAGHHRDHEFWCVGKGDPDGGLTYRESAREVMRMHVAGELGAPYPHH